MGSVKGVDIGVVLGVNPIWVDCLCVGFILWHESFDSQPPFPPFPLLIFFFSFFLFFFSFFFPTENGDPLWSPQGCSFKI